MTSALNQLCLPVASELLLVLALCAASVAVADHYPATPHWIEAGESIVVLQSPRFYFDWEKSKVPLKIDLFHCVTRRVHQLYPQIRLVAQPEFVRVAFPDLDPKAAPVSPESLKLLLGNATLQSRIASLNIRYVVYAGTENDVETVWQGGECGGGYGGATCFGGGEWKKRSSYDVLIVDLKRHTESGAANAKSGTSWVAFLLPLVVGWASPTESRACEALGADVLRVLGQETTPQAADSTRPSS